MVISVSLPMLFSATENRLLQQTISIVEQNGTQVLQNAALNIRNSEKILSPAIGATGSVLALQTSSGALNPVIIGINSGSIYIIKHATRELISSPQVAVQDFIIRNTSTSASRQSVSITFRVSRTIRLQQPHSYTQRFESAVALFPDDVATGDECGCAAPACQGNNVYGWQVCENSTCLAATSPLQCP